ncbi:MAG TPA: aspartate-semialdehyde dehydrogenase [Thermococcaceae archaeon]|uniref:Aspartate-semialdehyde dehydrogenase n=2 Tax=Thermococcus sibiricus TaxID=172049 RepID=C6A4V5_THESM|nr:aspartate-semialdehyde dehydrogenase [Thermococcus sibiricus]ACS90650.1 Aspartate-semialdehyde dehydrogenase [Thermococcus sibiricus MM 739]KUK17955.1 MAG: Aspartate-semialdehyde dehydrogenase [Thermococcus sibiricus]KUK29304.1 MAG: Aspartate-semialdehyde dehydrogenase [Thermococcus sp. 40_45]HII67914.1 aspartate-semialdehyde dehydrogenase [Thermococcaceae archaeon]
MEVAILGATGLVGQSFVRLLENHPWFDVKYLIASQRSKGRKFRELATWEVSEEIGEMRIESLEEFDGNVDLVFSALPSSIAGNVEEKLAEKIPVFSNASSHRYEGDVPILVPEVNGEHLSLVEAQREKRGWEGFIVTNPNCSTAILVISLKALSKFGIQRVNVVTMQAISGAGFSGLSAMQIFDNVIPYIEKEEWKVENESRKILGKLENNKITPASFEISVITTRVPVSHGHTEAVFVELEEDPTVEELKKSFESFDPLGSLKLPSYAKPLLYKEIPQPKFHRDFGGGMTVTFGRMEKIEEGKFKYITLGHNLIRGAAGGSILNAELAHVCGIL